MSLSNTEKRLTGGIILIIVLSICLSVTTGALVYATITIEYNVFFTGIVDINLNEGKPVIDEHEFLFEPGMRVVKDFFLESNSSADVYYRIYFADVTGGLADVLEITVRNGDKILYQCTAKDFYRENVPAADDVLRPSEIRNLTLEFYFPPEKGNAAQNQMLSFELRADATQTKNNPGKLFD